MRKEVIAVDLDDVVVETAQLVVDYVNNKYGTHVHLRDFYSRDPDVWETKDTETAVARIYELLESDEYFESPPIQEAIAAIRSLKLNHTLLIVTGRPDFMELATRKWLKNHLPDIFEDVVFTNYFSDDKARSKGDVCRELGATFLIDDHLDHCFSALEQGITPLLFGNYPWNAAKTLPAGIVRVDNWQEVLEFFDAKS